ncbi:hypothetical protein BpHYR1_042605 [Brachionus plicatilis]|uniref:Uncharacterized protein n=1 Tax=Brachionus plicatilis TaxID=10195 RepID=A0A3M7PYQ3_BRAPC|nr:hypothetical protein BpHYR1_042605 [Brachionus plicatilis]
MNADNFFSNQNSFQKKVDKFLVPKFKHEKLQRKRIIKKYIFAIISSINSYFSIIKDSEIFESSDRSALNDPNKQRIFSCLTTGNQKHVECPKFTIQVREYMKSEIEKFIDEISLIIFSKYFISQIYPIDNSVRIYFEVNSIQ